MTEVQLQSKVMVAFLDKYPEKKGQLFHVSNERNHKLQVFNAQAIGIVPGVADYIYAEGIKIDNLKVKSISKTIGIRKKDVKQSLLLYLQELGLIKLVLIELKVPNSRHARKTIVGQVRWAKTMISLGAVWRLCSSVEDAISCTEGNYKGLTVSEVEQKLNSVKTQSIKF